MFENYSLIFAVKCSQKVIVYVFIKCLNTLL